MKRFCNVILFFCLMGISDALAQKLILTTGGLRSSDDPSCQYVEYPYRDGVGQKELKDYCILQLSQPDFLSYRVDYADEQTIKFNGYTKPHLKGLKFNLLIEFGRRSVKVSAELFDKDGSPINEQRYSSQERLSRLDKLSRLSRERQLLVIAGETKREKKERKKAEKFVKKHKDEVEWKLDEIIHSMMEMKVVMH